MSSPAAGSSWFQRFLLPGFAFKAVIIGGGYATGRELAEFFLPSGPWGGLAAMILAMAAWSLIAALTFALAVKLQALDYRAFFKALLGPGWIVFEIAYLLFVVLILAVFGAAAGAIGEAMFDLPPLVGTAALALMIAAFAAFGNDAVEGLFKWVSFLLYGVYAIFLVFALSRFGDRIAANFSAAEMSSGWAVGGLTYASYNVVGAVVILPVLRHLTRPRDAAIAGIIAGPLAMAPAILFFCCMIAFYPGIEAQTLPSDFMLGQLGVPLFHLLFQIMIFSALLESGTGAVHAINERLDTVSESRRGRTLTTLERGTVASVLLVACMFAADRFGLVALIANGYRALAWTILVVFVLPLLTIGVWRLTRAPQISREILT